LVEPPAWEHHVAGWDYAAGMPEVSVYLPDDLYRRARESGISLSAVMKEAVERALSASDVAAWIARERARPTRARREADVASLMEEVHTEFGL